MRLHKYAGMGALVGAACGLIIAVAGTSDPSVALDTTGVSAVIGLSAAMVARLTDLMR